MPLIVVAWLDPGIDSATLPAEQSDVGTNRASASLAKLQELNTSVKVHAVAGPVTEELLAAHTVVVLVGSTLDEAVKWNAFCRTQSPPIKVPARTRTPPCQPTPGFQRPTSSQIPGPTLLVSGGHAQNSTHINSSC